VRGRYHIDGENTKSPVWRAILPREVDRFELAELGGEGRVVAKEIGRSGGGMEEIGRKKDRTPEVSFLRALVCPDSWKKKQKKKEKGEAKSTGPVQKGDRVQKKTWR